MMELMNYDKTFLNRKR